jgi:hypothetical protein
MIRVRAAAPVRSAAGTNAMQNEDVKRRIRTIRSRVREERELLSKLNRTVTDSNLKRLLRPASHSLDDVEGFFLDAKILQEKRSSAVWARWLREAEKVLRRATQQRESFELIIKKFGPDARLISG